MPQEQERPYTSLDAAMLTGAFALGLAWAWAANPLLDAIYGDNYFHYQPRWSIHSPYISLNLFSTTLLPLTLMVVAVRLRRPRPRLAFRQPGVAACVAASVVLLAGIARYPVRQATLFAELTRVQGDAYTNIVQFPKHRDFSGFLSLVGAIVHGVGQSAGLAVAGVFLAYWAAQIPSTGPSWIDRLGRLLGVFWIIVALGFLATPMAWE
jgi:hypothetical protein